MIISILKQRIYMYSPILFGSIIAILSGLSTYFLGWLWVDPLASMILSILVLKAELEKKKSISLGIKKHLKN